MADGKQQPQQSAETVKAAAAQSAKREALLAKAKERIDKVDVADDQKRDAKEAEVKKKALEFVSNECLTLPEDRFFKLIDAIEVRMKQKEAYKQNLVEEFKKVRKEIADSIVQTGSPIRENTAILKTEYVPKKLTKDLGDNLTSYPTTVISNNFRPEKFSAGYDMPMLEVMEKYPKSADQFYQQIRKEDSRTVGFLMFWGPDHPAFKELHARGMARAIEMITKVEARLRTEFGVPRNSDIGGGDEKEKTKIIAKRVSAWKTGDKFNAAANEAFDILNFDRKVFINKFASHPKGMSEEDYTRYVKRSANYLEYAASKWETGKREFFEQLEKDPETVAGFITNWNVNNQIYQALSLRGKADSVGLWVHRVKNEVMRKYGVPVGSDTMTNYEKNLGFVRSEMGRSKADKAYDMAWTAKEAFSGTASNDIRAARHLNAATASGNEKAWDTFISSLKADPKKFAQFIYAWNENSSLGIEIRRNNGAKALEKLNELKKRAHVDYSIPMDLSGMKKDHALSAIEKWLNLNAETWKKREALTEKIKEQYPDYRKFVEAAFAEMREWVLANKPKMVDKAKERLVKFSNETLLPLHTEAQNNLGYYSDEKGNRFFHPQHQQIASLRVAIEAMNVIKLTDTGDEWYSDIKKVVMNDANKIWVTAKMQQVSRILDNGDFWAVVGFSSEYAGAVRVQKPMTWAEFDNEIRTKDIQNVDSEAFYQATCQMHVLGNLTSNALKSRWGEFKLLKIALHWGIVQGGNKEQDFNKSWAYKKLVRDRPQVAKAFEGVLKTIVLDREDDLRRMDEENADLKSLEWALKTIKPGISEQEIKTVLTDMKGKEGSVRYRALERLKGGELSVKEIEAFFSALSKVETHKMEKSARSMMVSEIRTDEISGIGEFSTLKKAAEVSYAKSKSAEDKAVLDILNDPKFKTVDKPEDPKGTTPRHRKLYELSAESLRKLANGAKHLPENSKLRAYLSAFRSVQHHAAEAEKSWIIADNAKPLKRRMDEAAKLPPVEKERRERLIDSLTAAAGKVASTISWSAITWIPWAPKSKTETGELSRAAKEIREAQIGLDIIVAPGQNSILRKFIPPNADASYGKSASYAQLVDDIAGGRVTITGFENDHFRTALEEKRRVPELHGNEKNQTAHPQDERQYESGILGRYSTVQSFSESKPGEKLDIWSGITAVKTEGGGLEVITSSGKLRFNSTEAEGAVQQIDLLKEAGAEFLIPAMKEIAAASQTRIKDGVGRAESGRILSTLSRAFGFESVARETDPKLMLEKFKTAANWTFWDGDIWTKARRLWILDPKNNALKHEVLVERMGKSA